MCKGCCGEEFWDTIGFHHCCRLGQPILNHCRWPVFTDCINTILAFQMQLPSKLLSILSMIYGQSCENTLLHMCLFCSCAG